MIYMASLFFPFTRDIVGEHLFCFFVQLNSTSVLLEKFFLRFFYIKLLVGLKKKVTKIKIILFCVCV